MSWLQRAQAQVFRGAMRAERDPLSGWTYQGLGMGASTAGVHVSPATALMLSAMWQGTRLLGEGIGGMPCNLLKQIDDNRRERVVSEFAYKMRWQPNAWQTAMQFEVQEVISAVMRGAFYARIRPGLSGFRDQLEPIHPDRVRPKRLPSGRIMYYIDNEAEPINQDQMYSLVLRTEEDGITPMSLIRYGAQQLGVALAADRYRGKFFKGVQSSIAVIDKDELGEEGLKNLHTSVSLYANGERNAFGVLPLEGDVSIVKLGFTPAEAQMAETLNAGISDVARWLNIPLHMLRSSNTGASAYASLEVFSAEFVTYSLRPIVIAIEQARQRDLLLPDEKANHFFEFNMDALLRGDLKSRYEAYRTGIMSGFLKRNEARLKENLDADDPELNKYIMALNMGQVDGAAGASEGAKVLEFKRQMAIGRDGYQMVMLANEAAGRVIRKEKAEIERLARKNASNAEGWQADIRAFYKNHVGYVAETMRIPVDRAELYAETQGQRLANKGVAVMSDWDWASVDVLALEALGVERAA
jgi:HK97 family phage portal protein